MSDGTIDLTNLVDKMKATFVLAGREYLIAQALSIPGLGPFAAWVIKNILSAVVDWGLTKLTDWPYMQAFFWNTALRKGAQAQDYVDAVNAKESLPPTATDEEFENAERLELELFDRFVRVTN